MENWEKSVLEKVLLESIKEQRSGRRWKIFFRFLWFFIFCIIAFSIFYNQEDNTRSGPVVAVVDLVGIIDRDSKTYDNLSHGLQDALKDKRTVAVIIRANSPGGSPVYSDMLYNEILRLRKLYPKKPISVVVESVCASGCYYIASAVDKIYASPASIVGSIGVISAGFGYTEIMKKIGVESRLQIAGKNKAMGYPFIPRDKFQELMQQQMLDKVHSQFINAVKLGRKNKLDIKNPELFSGRFWLGIDSVKLGLIDGIDTVDGLARREYNTENLVDYTVSQDIINKFTKRVGVELTTSFKQFVLDNQYGYGSFN